MPPRPRVAITLSCCPRCGWPEDEEDSPTPRAKPKTEPKKKADPPSDAKIDSMVGRRWMASDFGLSEADFKKHFTPTLIHDAIVYLYCERLDHKHATAKEEAECILSQIEVERNRPRREEDTVSAVDDCVVLKHTHGPEGQLICLSLQAAMSKEHMAWLKQQPWNQEPPVAPEAKKARRPDRSEKT